MGCGQSGPSSVIENNEFSKSELSSLPGKETVEMTVTNNEFEFTDRVVSTDYLDFVLHTSYASAKKSEALYNPSLNYEQDIHEYEYQQMTDEEKGRLKVQTIEKLSKAAAKYAANERKADEHTIQAHEAVRHQLVELFK